MYENTLQGFVLFSLIFVVGATVVLFISSFRFLLTAMHQFEKWIKMNGVLTNEKTRNCVDTEQWLKDIFRTKRVLLIGLFVLMCVYTISATCLLVSASYKTQADESGGYAKLALRLNEIAASLEAQEYNPIPVARSIPAHTNRVAGLLMPPPTYSSADSLGTNSFKKMEMVLPQP